MPRPLLLAHRGARLCAPENTFAAFDQALAHGCDGFEFDVRRTADGRGFVCHDHRFEGLNIAHAIYTEIVERWNARHVTEVLSVTRRKPPIEPEHLPCVEDVLERYSSSAFLNIELKDPALETALCAALREAPPQHGYVVSSFLPEVMMAVNRRDPRVPLGFICDQRRQLEQWNRLPVSHVMPGRKLVSRKLIQELHAAGKQVFVWTVNAQSEMLRLAEWGADAIISDDTEMLGRTFAAE